jgi:hypothetical protein
MGRDQHESSPIIISLQHPGVVLASFAVSPSQRPRSIRIKDPKKAQFLEALPWRSRKYCSLDNICEVIH